MMIEIFKLNISFTSYIIFWSGGSSDF